MKRAAIVVVLAVAILGITAALVLATPPKAHTTTVTVAVEGFHCPPCPESLQKDLAKLNGVSEVEATLKPAQVTAKIDESVLPVSQFLAAINTHPQAMDRQKTYTGTLQVYIDAEMCANQRKMCGGCFTEIPKRLKPVKGISKVVLDETGKIASLTFADKAKVTTTDIAKALGKSNFGFIVTFTPPAAKTNK